MTDTMAGGGRGGVGIRLFVEGGEIVKRTFDQVGDSGRKMWAEIAMGQKASNPALRAMSSIASDAKAEVGALAGEAGIAGRALSQFGTMGVMAAAGIGAVGIALATLSSETRAAMAFADEIDDAATKVGTSTTALQQYRFAMTEVGGEAKDADAALAGLTKTIGLAQSGLSPKAMKGFTALGFTKEQVDSWDSAEDAIPAIAKAVAALGKESEQAAAVTKIGASEMLALFRAGPEAIEAFLQKAQDLGYVMDKDILKKGAEANQQFETMQHIIDVQLKSAFIGLSDEVLTFTNYIADALRGLNNFVGVFERWKQKQDALFGDGFVDNLLAGNSGQALQGAMNALQSGRTSSAAQIIRSGGDLGGHGATLAEMQAFARGPAAPDTGGGRLADQSGHRSGGGGGRSKADQDADRLKQAGTRAIDQLKQDELSNSRDYIRAVLGATDTAESRATVARQLLDIDTAELQRKTDEQKQAITKAGLMTEDLQARFDQLEDLRVDLEAAKQGRITTEERKGIAERELEAARKHFEDEDAARQAAMSLLDIQLDLARTASQRFEISKRILAAEQEIERKALEARLGEDGLTSPGDWKRMVELQDRQRGETTLLNQNEDDRLRDQFKGYGREVVQAIEDGRIGESIGDELKSRLIDMALDGLFNIGRGGDQGGTMNMAFRAVSSIFGGGRASGGGVGSGYSYGMAEHGAELAVFGTNGQVMNHAETAQMVRDLAGVGGWSGGGGRGEREVIEVHIDKSPLWEAEVRRTAAPLAQAAAQQASMTAYAQSVKDSRTAAPRAVQDDFAYR